MKPVPQRCMILLSGSECLCLKGSCAGEEHEEKNKYNHTLFDLSVKCKAFALASQTLAASDLPPSFERSHVFPSAAMLQRTSAKFNHSPRFVHPTPTTGWRSQSETFENISRSSVSKRIVKKCCWSRLKGWRFN